MQRCPHCDQLHPEGTDYCPRSGHPLIDVAKRLIGRTIAGKYRLKKCIGQGGMGTIFEAEHTLIGNRVAVKLLHEPFAASREPVQRLYREARAAGSIGHENIISIFDVGETDDGIPFLVMELLEGESLGDRLENSGPTALGYCIDVGIQMLSALHAAHSAGIIHRDLKSDNIFLVRGEDPSAIKIKLLDFGVSKFTSPEEEGLRLTQTGSVLGTPYYMSPEQASGKKDLDERLDLYAAGVILYEMLLGNVPHCASNYNALLMEIITVDIETFAWRRPDIPKPLENLILKALERDRNKRWRRSLDFMEALVDVRDRLSPSSLTGVPAVIKQNLRKTSHDSLTLDQSSVAEADDGNPSPALAARAVSGFSASLRDRLSSRRALAAGGALLILLAAAVALYYAVFISGGSAPQARQLSAASAVSVSPDIALKSFAATAPDAGEKAPEEDGGPNAMVFTEEDAFNKRENAGKRIRNSSGKKASKGRSRKQTDRGPTGKSKIRRAVDARSGKEGSTLNRPMDNPF